MADVEILKLESQAQGGGRSPLSALDGAVCAFGVFDGLHRGHHVIFNKTLEVAEKFTAPSVVLTFDIDPDDLFNPEHMKLMSNEQRLVHLAEVGFDHVIALHFDEDFASIDANDFLNNAFSGNVPKALIVGSDLRFGRAGSGNVETLRAWGKLHGMDVIEMPLFEEDGKPIKSTRIRKLISEGKMQEAQHLLGHPLDPNQHCS